MSHLRKPSLTLEDLDAAWEGFHRELLAHTGMEYSTRVSRRLCIDDRELRTPSEKNDKTNGRYCFSNTEVYRNCYIPGSESPGVYLFFDVKDSAVYVGKSEADGGIGRRVASHIGKLEKDQQNRDSLPYLAFRAAKYAITIPFNKNPWLAPAFESYLLSKYHFAENTNLSGV